MEGRNDTLSRRNSTGKVKEGGSMGHSRNCKLFKWMGYRASFGEVTWLAGWARAGT